MFRRRQGALTIRATRACGLLALASAAVIGGCNAGPPDRDRGARSDDEAEAEVEVEQAGLRIDVAGHLSIAARTDPRPLRDFWSWGAVPMGIAVGPHGSVYWAEYRTDSVRRADVDGRDVETLATVDGPLGLAFDRAHGRVVYAADRHFPRSIGTLRAGGRPEPMVGGDDLNRPFAVAVSADTVYWTESVNGRVRSLAASDRDATLIFDDGIANVDETADAAALSPAGIAVDGRRGHVFWSDTITATITRASLDGTDRRAILRRSDGLDFPTGLAVDAAAGKLYWADPGAETIGRANLDGSSPEVFARAADGVLEPYGLAIDEERRLLYWTDVARNALYRGALDRHDVGRFIDLGASSPSVAGGSQAIGACDGVAAAAQREFLVRWVKLVRTCVAAVSATKAVMRTPGDLRTAAGTCVRQLSRAHVPAVLTAVLQAHCEAGGDTDALDRTLGLGAEIVAADLPRAARYLHEMRPFVAAASPAADALVALDDLVGRLDGLSLPAAAHDQTLPSSGQTTTYKASTQRAGGEAAVPDDGAVRAGAAPAFVDNGDGTLTDSVTGLMWEKKCDRCKGLHDVDARYPWRSADGRRTVSEWLRELNTIDGTGFAGHDDWRLPRIGEAVGIIDYENFNPAVGEPLNGARCGSGCASVTDAECSCTNLGPYWSAGDSAQPDDVVPVVAFNLGVVWGQRREDDTFVRAVRGPLTDNAKRFVDNGDGTVTDRVTRLMWEKKSLSPGQLHDVDLALHWSFDGVGRTVWDWLVAINEEGERGFAGHDDWRIPNVKELYSLFTEDERDPSIDRAFANDGCADLLDPRCSLTSDGLYWTSTTFADFPMLALVVNFNAPGELEEEAPAWVIRVVGGVEPHPKPSRMAVRAVRGPVSAGAIADR